MVAIVGRVQGLNANAPLSVQDLDRAVGLHRISRGIMRALAEDGRESIDRAIDDALSGTGALCAVDRAYVFRFRDGGEHVDNTHEWCADGVPPQIANLQGMPAAVAQSWVEAFERDEYVFIHRVADIGDDELELRRVLEAQEIQSLLVNPLRSGGRLIGFMGFDYVTAPSTLSWVDLDVLLAISENVAAALGRYEAEDRLRVAAERDALTGLLNRSAFAEAVRALIDAAQAGDPVEPGSATPMGPRVVVGLLDLDRFSDVNDRVGFAAGDAAIRAVARRLAAGAAGHELLARTGGDEFALLAPAGDDEDAACRIADRLRAVVAEPVEVSGHLVHLTASIGVAAGCIDPTLASDPFKDAEAAQREAQETGGDAAVEFVDEVGERLAARHRLAVALHAVGAFDHITVVYQPEVDLVSGRIIGAEALARWDAPSTGPVLPAQFIAVAEAIGAIAALSEDVIARALTDARDRFLTLEPDFRISVNLSAAHVVAPQFVERMRSILDRMSVPRDHVCFEITESVVAGGPVAIDAIRRLRDEGVDIEVDDFGTGYSSFARLRDLPFTGIKIDRSFVAGIEHDGVAQALVAAQAAIAASLGLSVVAEGIETDEERSMVLALEIATGQGFGLHRPMSADALAALLAAQR